MLQKAEPVRFTSPFAPYTGTPTITFLEPPAELTPPAIPSETATDSASQPREIEAGHTGTSEATTSAITAGTAQTREHLLALRRLCRETLGGESPFLEPALASYIANMRLHGSVVWLLMVAPPSSGKTLIIHLLAGLPCTLEADDISFGGLLSNCKKSERLANATGGLLREVDALGGTAVILASDLTEYLNEFTDKRSIMGAFRHVFDGHWNRANGADGGSRNIWGGRVGFIGGITEMVDRSNAIRSSMGERFLYFRSRQTLTESFRRALSANMMSEHERERKILEGVEALIDTIPQNPVVPTPGSISLRITSLATVIGILRTSVPRGSLVGAATAAPEGPTRLTQQLTSLYRGLLAIGCTAAEAWKTILKVAQDSTESTPYQVFKQLLVEPGEAVPTPRIAEALGRRTEDPTINRILHRFAALGLVVEIDPRATRNSWVLTSEAYEICRYAFIDDMPEPSPEEIADIMGCNAPIAILTEGPTVIAAGDSSVADDEDTPPDDDGGGGGGGLSLPQPSLATSEPDFDHDDDQDEFMGFDIRQAE